MTDDQTFDSFGRWAMPFTWELFKHEGTIFQQAIATPPLCCPARAGFLTGQYPHNHGVVANEPGYPLLRDKASVLPAWLRRAGYRTAFVGKFLNGREQVAEPAPGWDEWHANYNFPTYFDYVFNDGGELTHYGESPNDYSTSQYTKRAIEQVNAITRESPLFMWLAYNAPHLVLGKSRPCEGYVPQPQTPAAFEEFADEPLPHDASFDERDLADKPRFLRDQEPLEPGEIAEMELRWRCGLATLRAVDEGMRTLVGALRESGELERTVLVFVSDNGYFFGEHSIKGDKRLAYEASAHVPLAIRVGKKVAGAERSPAVDEVVGTIDLAPTLLDFAGAEPCLAGGCRPLDGRSLRPLLSGADEAWPSDRAVLLELEDDYTYEALRTRRYLYSRLSADRDGPLPTRDVELYDLRTDPHELDNLWRTDRDAVQGLGRELADRLDALVECEGSIEERFRAGGAAGNCE